MKPSPETCKHCLEPCDTCPALLQGVARERDWERQRIADLSRKLAAATILITELRHYSTLAQLPLGLRHALETYDAACAQIEAESDAYFQRELEALRADPATVHLAEMVDAVFPPVPEMDAPSSD